MKITNEDTLDLFRGPGPCEYCGIGCMRREPHHITSVGAGGSDIGINLIALGGTGLFRCSCHALVHAGKIDRQKMKEIAAKREGVSVEDAQAVVWLLLRLPPRPSVSDIEKELEGVSEAVGALVMKELKRAGYLQ